METHRLVASRTCSEEGGLEPATLVYTLDHQSNRRPFGAQANTLTTKNTGQGYVYFMIDTRSSQGLQLCSRSEEG